MALRHTRYNSLMTAIATIRRPRTVRRSDRPAACCRKLDGVPLHEYQVEPAQPPYPWRYLRCRWCEHGLTVGEPRLFD